MSPAVRIRVRRALAGLAAAVAAVIVPPAALAQLPDQSYFEWRISSSSTDAEVQAGPPFVGEQDLYLWLTCSIQEVGKARMDLTGSLEIVSFAPEGGVTVASPLPLLDLDIGCQGGPWVLVGTLRVRDAVGSGGEICMGAARRTFRCDLAYDDSHAFLGYTTLGPDPCYDAFCGIDYVDPLSWGRVKAYYEGAR